MICRRVIPIILMGMILLNGCRKSLPVSTADTSSRSLQPEADGVVLKSKVGELAHGTLLKISFPTDMVREESVGHPGLPNPVIFEPPLDSSFFWTSAREVTIDCGRWGWFDEIAPKKITYRVTLRPGLTDAAGRPVQRDNWGGEFAAEEFGLRSVKFIGDRGDDLKAPLSLKPRLRLEFSRDAAPETVAQSCHFQDAQSQERYPVVVGVEERQSNVPQGWMFVEPAQDLPVGRSFYFVVDRLPEARAQTLLPHLRVIAAGSTQAFKNTWGQSYNQPARGAFVRLGFNQKVDAASVSPSILSVHPEAGPLRFETEGKFINVYGNFAPGQQYTVTIHPGVKAPSGAATTEETLWRLSFNRKRPAVILDQETLFQRMSEGLKAKFIQVNTGPLTWRVAALPAEQLATVKKRLREFGAWKTNDHNGPLLDPQSNEVVYPDTELLIPKLNLPVIASGAIADSEPDREIEREITWKAPNPAPAAGLYLLEISGTDARGRLVGNRALVSLSDWAIIRRAPLASMLVHLSKLSDGKQVEGVLVTALDSDGNELANARTGPNGDALLPISKAEFILAGEPGAQCLQWTTAPALHGSVYGGGPPQAAGTLRAVIVTDRDVYRPGDTMHFKAYLHLVEGTELRGPSIDQVTWSINPQGGARNQSPPELHTTPLSPDGSFEGEAKFPMDKTDFYTITVAGGQIQGSATVTVTDFHPPGFKVTATPQNATGDSVGIQVESTYFHGAPNSGALVRWRAHWLVDDWRDEDNEFNPSTHETLDLSLSDRHSPDSASGGISEEVRARIAKAGFDASAPDHDLVIAAADEGETHLDGQGSVLLRSKTPFSNQQRYGRMRVLWTVDVIAADAQTLRVQKVSHAQTLPQLLAAGLSMKDLSHVEIQLASLDLEDRQKGGQEAKAELFRVTTKTVREKLSSDLHRYRNFPVFEKIWEGRLTTPATQVVEVSKPGSYIVRANVPGEPLCPQVSAQTEVTSFENNERESAPDFEKLACNPERKEYQVGEVAAISIGAPFSGVATVWIEREQVIDSFAVEMKGSSPRLEIPVKPEYFPGVSVSVHLLRPATKGAPAAERAGGCDFRVQRPDLTLQVAPKLTSGKVRPGSEVGGVITVRSGDAPEPDAEVLVMAVDEAALRLGKWAVPDFFRTLLPFYPPSYATFPALPGPWQPTSARKLSHLQKGFIVGGFGPEWPKAVDFRVNFATLAYWNAKLRTDAHGEAQFRFIAPDALTAYRVTAVAHAARGGFGSGSASVLLAKPLQVEPALPAFLREGDLVNLRAVVRLTEGAAGPVRVECSALEGLQLTEGAEKTVTPVGTEPAVATFRARTLGKNSATVRFTARLLADGSINDGAQESLPIHPSTIQRRQTLAGPLEEEKAFSVVNAAPEDWSKSVGEFDLIFSSSPVLAKAAGLPDILEGGSSIEQISTRIITSLNAANLMAFLPSDPAREARTNARLKADVEKLEASLLKSGSFPAWPGGSETDPLSTIFAVWALRQLQSSGYQLEGEIKYAPENWLAFATAANLDNQRPPLSPLLRAFSLLAVANRNNQSVANDQRKLAAELFENRNLLGIDGRAILALILHNLSGMAPELALLLKEIQGPIPPLPFDPETLASPARTEALRLLAQTEALPGSATPSQRRLAWEKISGLFDSSPALSTHENFWLLLALNAFLKSEVPAKLAGSAFVPPANAASPNDASAGWLGQDVASLRNIFAAPLKAGVNGSWLLQATLRRPVREPVGSDSFALERTWVNLTDAQRTGSATAPLHLGDRLLVTYRFPANRPHYRVQLEDQLPACFASVNPDMISIARYFKLPALGSDALVPEATERFDEFARLSFRTIPQGARTCAMVASVNAAGHFIWPSAKAAPVYDPRYGALSGDAELEVSEP